LLDTRMSIAGLNVACTPPSAGFPSPSPRPPSGVGVESTSDSQSLCSGTSRGGVMATSGNSGDLTQSCHFDLLYRSPSIPPIPVCVKYPNAGVQLWSRHKQGFLYLWQSQEPARDDCGTPPPKYTLAAIHIPNNIPISSCVFSPAMSVYTLNHQQVSQAIHLHRRPCQQTLPTLPPPVTPASSVALSRIFIVIVAKRPPIG
jgi:hypothetical protein